jgi:hypothetical protein
VALGSNLKKELPGLRLNLKKVSSLSRRHKRNNHDDISSINGSALKKSAQSQDRKSSVSRSRSNKKKK